MRESTFEDILVKYSDLIEDGLTLLGRQHHAYGRIMDLIFRDAFNRELIIELKAGAITDKAVGQILSYEGMLLSGDNPTIRIMLIATRVPPNIRRALDHHGIAWREITVHRLKEYLIEKDDSTFLTAIEGAESLATVPVPRNFGGNKRPKSPTMPSKGSGPNIIIPYGTARKNIKSFVPLQRTYIRVNDEEEHIPDDYFNVDGIIFSRMTTKYSRDKIEYEIKDPEKDKDVPILVSVHNIKLYRPIQITGSHIGDPNRKFTGSPKPNKISDELASELLEDAMETNPSLRDDLKSIYNKYFGK